MILCQKISAEWKLYLGFLVGAAFGIVLSALFERLSKLEKTKKIWEMKTHEKNESFHKGLDIIARELSDRVRVLCLVLTYPDNHFMAHTVKATWGKRCNVLLLMSTEENKTIPTIALPVREGYAFLYGKVKESFRYINKHYLNTFDWVLKVDDNTYVVMENLRYMLADYNASEAIYFGRRLQNPARKPKPMWMSGGAGYVLSKEAFRRLLEEGLGKHRCTPGEKGAEDVLISKCLELVGVKPRNSTDYFNRGRFFPFSPKDHIFLKSLNPNAWYHRYNVYHDREGLNCCSDVAISFHYIDQNNMYTIEFLVYHLKTYGTNYIMVDQVNQTFTNTNRTLNIMS